MYFRRKVFKNMRWGVSVNENIFKKLDEIISKVGNKATIVFLKGFSLNYVSNLMEKYKPLNSNVNETGCIDLIGLTKQIKPLFLRIMSADQGIYIGLYEELMLAKDTIKDIYDGEIIIVENNFYPGLYPVDYDHETQRMLKKMVDSVKSEQVYENDNHKVFEIISDYYELGDEAFASYYDLPDQLLLQTIPLIKGEKAYPLIEELPNHVEPFPFHIDHKGDYLRFCISLERGDIGIGLVPLLIEYNPTAEERIASRLFVWQKLFPDCDFKFYYINRIKDALIRPDFSQLLNKYWQADNFRKIEFYENPDSSPNKICITQGTIIESIVEQVEKAANGKEFQDVFVTAPTGAGKSLLFQIPAIYLAAKSNLLTIVISPLKALMLDQVSQLKEKGIDGVAYINSDLSHIQKQEIIDKVKKAEISILYLSPELLLAYDIRSLIGDERKIGLIVVDEAHLVTTWGRDFRIDYWYLGSYIEKLRANTNDAEHSRFVVAAFTATAVYGGNDDMVFETINSLNMNNPIKFLGNTRRKNISFNINLWKAQKSYDIERFEITKARIGCFVQKKKKTIVYAPYRRHIDEIFDALESNIKAGVVKFHAGIAPEYKKYFEQQFHKGHASLMLATKAFGMGIDISDIEVVYHHAPTGNLCDYVQEIGRAGRNELMKGIAFMDFNMERDLNFARTLYGLSGMRQYQLKEVIIKLNRIYLQEKRRNFLVNAETFRFIFPGNDDYENKLKNALLLIEKDLQSRYTYPVLIVRPKSLFSKAYAVIDNSISKEFLSSKYGCHIKKLSKYNANKNLCDNGREYVLHDAGDVFEIDLKSIWENYFSHMSFPMLKKSFYEKNLFESPFTGSIYPRYKIIYKFVSSSKMEIISDFKRQLDDLKTFFSYDAKGIFFTKEFFRKYLKDKGYGEVERRKIVNTVLELYSMKLEGNNHDKFIQMRRVKTVNLRLGEENEEYRIANADFYRIFSTIINRFDSLFGKENFDGELATYLAVRENDPFMSLAYLLEAFSIAGYEVRGGESPEIFIRINDPYRFATLASSDKRYSNSVLQDIKERQQRSFKILSHFFVDLIDDKERWDFIESYFLGKIDIEH